MYNIIHAIWSAVWFMLPAFTGNIAPLLVKQVPVLNYPVDGYVMIGKKRIFGDHKTWRGIIIGLIVGTLTALFQHRALFAGAVLAAGNFAGDLFGAFVKRRVGVEPGGKSLFIDAVPGPFFAVLFAWAGGFLTLNWIQICLVTFGIIPIHLLFNRLWYAMRLKSVPW